MVATRPLLKRDFDPLDKPRGCPSDEGFAASCAAAVLLPHANAAQIDDRLATAACGGRSCPRRKGKRPRRSVRGHKPGPRHWLPRRTGCARWRGTDGELGAGRRTPRTGAHGAEHDRGALRPAPSGGDLQARDQAGSDPGGDLRRGRDAGGVDPTDQRLPRRRRARVRTRCWPRWSRRAQPAATAREAEDALARAALPLPAFVQCGLIDAGKTLALLRPAATTSVVFRGTLGRKVPTRTDNLDVGAGSFTALVRFAGGKRLALATPIGQAAGRSPLQVNGTSTPGTFALRVTGTGTKTSFVLAVTYVR